METNDKLSELVDFIDSARSMPLSSSVLVNKQELVQRIDEIRDGLPADLAAADEIITKQETLLAQAQSQADRIVEQGRAEQGRMVAEHTVLQVARLEADRERTQAQDAAEAAKRDAEDHLDAKLAHMEMIAQRMLDVAKAGREQLQHTAYDELTADSADRNDEAPAISR